MTTPKNSDIVKNKELTQTQLNFLAFCEKFGWGKLEVQIKNGEPTIAKIVEQTIKFD